MSTTTHTPRSAMGLVNRGSVASPTCFTPSRRRFVNGLAGSEAISKGVLP
jgi:hypothetical protein